jgi:hypothetical protein
MRHFYYVGSILLALRLRTALDFGCGKGRMADALSQSNVVQCVKYDPAMPEFEKAPSGRFDTIINTDVLEHIPEEELSGILARFKDYSSQAIIIPHLGKASAVLPDGQNAHCTIKTPKEWRDVFQDFYRHVKRLPHDSRNHALFFCSDTSFDTRLLEACCYMVRCAKTSANEGTRQSSEVHLETIFRAWIKRSPRSWLAKCWRRFLR